MKEELEKRQNPGILLLKLLFKIDKSSKSALMTYSIESYNRL